MHLILFTSALERHFYLSCRVFEVLDFKVVYRGIYICVGTEVSYQTESD